MRFETSFDLNGDLIVIDAVVVGPTGQATVELVLDTGSVLTTLATSIAEAIGYSEATAISRTVTRTAAAVEHGYLVRLAELSTKPSGASSSRGPVHDVDGPIATRQSTDELLRSHSMQRYAPRLISAGSAPAGALVEALIANPPPSPLGEHEQLPQVAWMVDVDGAFVHVPASERAELELFRGLAQITMLDGELSNETLDDMPGINLATNGAYAAELLLDPDHLTALHEMLGSKLYLVGAPRRGRLLVGGVRAGVDGMRAFVAAVRREHDDAPEEMRISPVAMLVRDGAPTAVVGELQLGVLAQVTGS